MQPQRRRVNRGLRAAAGMAMFALLVRRTGSEDYGKVVSLPAARSGVSYAQDSMNTSAPNTV